MTLPSINYKQFWLWRAAHGGVWVNFNNGTWERCSWVKEHEGYMYNHYTGGMFHKTLTNVVMITTFPYELVKNPIAKPNPAK